jgi:hypothetical protein
MAAHYAIFYCLENSIRELIVQRLEEVHGSGSWDKAVPENLRKDAEANRKKEAATGITPRSSELIDYSNFGELGEVIKTNWDIFGDMFQDVRAVERVLSNLNTLHAPIAHCKTLAEDEVLRLHLSLRDWFRQMEWCCWTRLGNGVSGTSVRTFYLVPSRFRPRLLYSQPKHPRFQTSAQPSPPVLLVAPRSKQYHSPLGWASVGFRSSSSSHRSLKCDCAAARSFRSAAFHS